MKILLKVSKLLTDRAWWKKLVLDIRVKVIGVLVLTIIIGVCVPYLIVSHIDKLRAEKSASQECSLEHELRIDCLPGTAEENQTRERCELFDCCWEDFGSSIPSCFHSHPTKYTYNIEHMKPVPSGYKFQLSPNFKNTSLLTVAKERLFVDIEFWTADHMRILIHDGTGFDLSEYVSYKYANKSECLDTNYEVTFVERGRFHFQVYRKSVKKGIPMFNTFYGPLIVSEGFTEITTMLPSFNLYGIGKAQKSTFRHNLRYARKYELFSRIEFDNDEFSDTSTGVYPFYMVMEDDGKAHGVLLLTSLPTEIVTRGIPSVTFRTMDTRLDIHLFLGPNPADVVKQYTEYVGRPAMPPYWGLGYHSCRLTTNWNDSTSFIRFTRSKRIPHESDCGSSELFAPGKRSALQSNITDFVQELKTSGRKFLVFHLPHIAVEQGDGSGEIDIQGYVEALKFKSNIFVRDSVTNEIFIGILKNGLQVLYPDFFQEPDINIWMKNELDTLLENSNFDGLLLHLNTPLNNAAKLSLVNATTCGDNEEVTILSSRIAYLNNGTVCMDALHVGDKPHAHFHNIYGYKHLSAVKSSIKELKKFKERRPFLLSMSTFLGSGAHGGHWGGLYNSTWDSLKETLVQMLDFSLFGIPFYGSPACGTYGPIDSVLCSRWFQLSAFQPFVFSYRNDELDILSNNRRMTSVGRSMLQLRYSLLPYLYGLFYNATYRGETVIRPLFFEFSHVRETYGIDEQFMWGSSLLISPIMKPSTEKVKAFFPPGCWYDYYSGKKEVESVEGVYKVLSSAEHHINLHIRGGHIIPTQLFGFTTEYSRQQNFTITICLNCFKSENGRSKLLDSNSTLAVGEIFIDDGYSDNAIDKGHFVLLSLLLKGRVLIMHCNSNNRTKYTISDNVSHTLNTIHFYGLSEDPLKFFIDGKEVPFVYNFIFESATLDGLGLNIVKDHVLRWEPKI